MNMPNEAVNMIHNVSGVIWNLFDTDDMTLSIGKKLSTTNCEN